MTIRTTILFSALLLLPAGGTQAQASTPHDTAYTPGGYRVFTDSGARATLDDIVQAMASQQVVFIGETHDDPTGHMLELELLRRAAIAYGDSAASGRTVVLSLEFFERDVQSPRGLHVIAANAPRRYVGMVAREAARH